MTETNLDRWATRLIFFMMCAATALLVYFLVHFARRRRGPAGAALPGYLRGYFAFATLGAFLSALANYGPAFDPLPRHTLLRFAYQIGSLGVFGAGFWIYRAEIRRTFADTVAANGGTPLAALASFLRHPGKWALRVQKYRQDRTPPAHPPTA